MIRLTDKAIVAGKPRKKGETVTTDAVTERLLVAHGLAEKVIKPQPKRKKEK